jgi:hypothetical protein
MTKNEALLLAAANNRGAARLSDRESYELRVTLRAESDACRTQMAADRVAGAQSFLFGIDSADRSARVHFRSAIDDLESALQEQAKVDELIELESKSS